MELGSSFTFCCNFSVFLRRVFLRQAQCNQCPSAAAAASPRAADGVDLQLQVLLQLSCMCTAFVLQAKATRTPLLLLLLLPPHQGLLMELISSFTPLRASCSSCRGAPPASRTSSWRTAAQQRQAADTYHSSEAQLGLLCCAANYA